MHSKLAADDALVQLATRIPRRTAVELRRRCIEQDVHVQSFVRAALEEKLARARAGARPRRRRA